MTRKEQIKEASQNEMMKYPNFCITAPAFSMGAEWADAHPGWISVEVEIPKDGALVIAITPDSKVAIAQYENDEWNISDLYCLKKVTHWMPLPAPPEHIADVSKKIGSSEKPSTCKKFDIPGYENVVIHEGNAKGGILKGGEL